MRFGQSHDSSHKGYIILKIHFCASGQEPPKKGTPLKAGYSYTAKKDSPLGHELSFKPNDSLRFIEAHETNPAWWVAEAADGTLGYVPAAYMIVSRSLSSVGYFVWGHIVLGEFDVYAMFVHVGI